MPFPEFCPDSCQIGAEIATAANDCDRKKYQEKPPRVIKPLTRAGVIEAQLKAENSPAFEVLSNSIKR
jgi:hypothetical protein